MLMSNGEVSNSQIIFKMENHTRLFLTFLGDVILCLAFIVFLLALLGKVVLGRRGVINKIGWLNNFLGIYRVLMLDLLFLPVLQLLVRIRVECTGLKFGNFYQGLECYNVNFEQLIAVSMLVGLFLHVSLGILFELLTFEFNFALKKKYIR